MSISSSASRPPPQKPLDLDLTIVSAKHLKNVNWKNGDLKPYAVFWVDPDRRLSTKSDDSGSTRPVWNERFTLPIISLPLHDAVLTLEIFHSKPSETPKPLVATLRLPLIELLDSDPPDPARIRTYTLTRPSGRPQGKIRVKIGFRERPLPDYQFAPPQSYYYTSAPPPPPLRDYRGGYTAPPPPPPPPQPVAYSTYPEAYPGYYSGYYSSAPPPPLPQRPLFDRTSSYSGPSAPVDYSPYDQKAKSGGKMGLGTGLAVGAVAGVLGGLALEEGLKYEEEKTADRVESDLATRDDYSDYRSEY